MFISNGAMIYSSLKNNAMFSNAVSIGFVVIACIPAVASIYVYFIYDFNTEIKIKEKSNELNENHESDELCEINESQNQLEQSENKLDQIENEDNSMNQKIENEDNSLNQQMENEDNSLNQQNKDDECRAKILKWMKAFEDCFEGDDYKIVGNNNMIDNIAKCIKAITPIAFLFYGLSISLFSKSNKL